MQFFRNLQRKPKNVRNHYAFALASTFTGVVALVWFVSTASQISQSSNGEMASNDNGESPFSNLIKQSKEQLANLKGSADDSGTEKKETEQSVDGIATNTNPMNITLSEEEISNLRANQASSSLHYNYISTTTINSNQPIYQEVMIATTSSSSTKNQLDGQASTSARLFR